MKSYFSWKRLVPFSSISNRHEQPDVQPDSIGPQSSSCGVLLLEYKNVAAVKHATITDIMIRTIVVSTPQQEIRKAALLCCFTVPDAGMNYLAYSLNELVNDNDVRVYIAELRCEQGRYRLATTITNHTWRKAFGEIVGQLQDGQEATWYYIDIEQQLLPVAPSEEHASISLNTDLVRGLVLQRGTKTMGQAIEWAPIPSPRREPATSTLDAAQGSSSLARFIDQSDDQDEQLDDVQKSLSSILAIAQVLEQRDCASAKQHQQLEELQNQLLEKERELNDKAQELACRYAALINIEGRAAELLVRSEVVDEREAALRIRGEELALGQQKLFANRARFSSIVKKFHMAVQLKSVAPGHLNEIDV